MEKANLLAAWAGILLGFLAGAVQGLWFHREDWLGGYASWRRRMLRLAHISFFGIAFINLSFFVTVSHLEIETVSLLASRLLIAGAVSMPSVCYLSAFRKEFRHLFFIPVTCLVLGAGLFVFGSLL